MVLPSYADYPVVQPCLDINVRQEDIISDLGAFIWNQREDATHYSVARAILEEEEEVGIEFERERQRIERRLRERLEREQRERIQREREAHRRAQRPPLREIQLRWNQMNQN